MAESALVAEHPWLRWAPGARQCDSSRSGMKVRSSACAVGYSLKAVYQFCVRHPEADSAAMACQPQYAGANFQKQLPCIVTTLSIVLAGTQRTSPPLPLCITHWYGPARTQRRTILRCIDNVCVIAPCGLEARDRIPHFCFKGAVNLDDQMGPVQISEIIK